jgi:alginate O-acetyltransferase complex protein AlgI
MLFNSFGFLLLLSVTFLIYYIPALKQMQLPVLITASLIFYSYSQPTLVFLLLTSVIINIFSSYYITYGPARLRKFYAIAGVALNLSLLLFFKYSPLFGKTFFNETDSVGQFLINIPLPIGISFFTFQGISLVVDVYTEKYQRREEVIPRSLLEHAKRVFFFKGFFPQLVSGPIVKAHDFLPQIGTKYFKDIDWDFCFRHLVVGYFLKMVIADNLKDQTYWIKFPYFEYLSSTTLFFLLIGYSCQIFADFAGYSLIAMGLARLFGYHFPVNFNFPYISTSFSEFWKRWHISLSSFLKEYLYIPLGGNKKGNFRTYINLFTTMFLGGLWHGAAWSYAVWGTFHGLALAVERFFGEKLKLKKSRGVRILQATGVFLFVTIAWLLFKLPEFSHVISYIRSMAGNFFLDDNYTIITYIFIYSLPVFIYHLAYLLENRFSGNIYHKTKYSLYGVMLFMILVNSGSSGAFIYFQF